jgi:hypothetical protein
MLCAYLFVGVQISLWIWCLGKSFSFLLKMNTVICCILAVEQLLLGVHERW